MRSSYQVAHDAACGHNPVNLDFKRVRWVIAAMVTHCHTLPPVTLPLGVWVEVDKLVVRAAGTFCAEKRV